MFSIIAIIIIFLVFVFTNPSLLEKDKTTASFIPIRAPVNIESHEPDFPYLREGWEDLELEAKAAIVLDRETGKILYGKNINERLPIASLTKLMTALIVVENTDLDEKVIISKKAVETEGNRVDLWPQEAISVKNLLCGLLVSSSNDAAVALAEHLDLPRPDHIRSGGDFVDLMNERARTLGLKNTHFANSAGFDEPENSSTAYDLVRFTSFLLDRPLIFEILRIPRARVYSTDGRINHLLLNTNKLLGVLPNIIGGKTGFTEEAGQTLILVIKEPTKNHHIISVVLGSDDKFADTEKMVKWVLEAYKW